MQAVGLLFTPESPVWLHWKGRRATALYYERLLLGSLWREEGEVDADAHNLEEPLQGHDNVEVRPDTVIQIRKASAAASRIL